MTTPKHVSGTVRQLEWEARSDILGLHNAKGSDGYWYNVQKVADGIFVYEGHPSDMPDPVSSKHATLAAAKAAAQADYAARILAAIQPDPEPQPVACPECSDTGMRDTGGVHPWGEHISAPCDCTPSSAGTVSVEAAIQLAQKFACEDVGFEIALRALAGEGER